MLWKTYSLPIYDSYHLWGTMPPFYWSGCIHLHVDSTNFLGDGRLVRTRHFESVGSNGLHVCDYTSARNRPFLKKVALLYVCTTTPFQFSSLFVWIELEKKVTFGRSSSPSRYCLVPIEIWFISTSNQLPCQKDMAKKMKKNKGFTLWPKRSVAWSHGSSANLW